MTSVAVIDHGAGNLVSIAHGLERAGATVTVANSGAELGDCDGMVLPGVGATASVMDGIRRGGFEMALTEPTVPLLGICVGMQVLFESSDEDNTICLGLLGGVNRRLSSAPKLPHIGWNDVVVQGDDPLFDGIDDPVTYFVHSFAPEPTDPSVVIATSEYGAPFVAAVRGGIVAGTQFHPERSGAAGLRILANFVHSLPGRART